MGEVKSTEEDGMAFADALFALVHRLGPREYSTAQKEAMAEYLLESAIEWAKAAGRLALQEPTND